MVVVMRKCGGALWIVVVVDVVVVVVDVVVDVVVVVVSSTFNVRYSWLYLVPVILTVYSPAPSRENETSPPLSDSPL